MNPFIAAILLTATVAACSKPALNSPETITITKGKCVQRTAGTDKLNVCYNELVQDSRCPRNARCIWAGMVVVKLGLTVNNETHTLTLSSDKRASGFATDTTVNGYKISLVDVAPYPGDPVQTPVAKILLAKN